MVLEETTLPTASARRWLVGAAGVLLAMAAVVAVAPPHAGAVPLGAHAVHGHAHPR